MLDRVVCLFSLHRILMAPSAMARQRSVCASSFGRPPAVTRLIASASCSHGETYAMKPLPPPLCECGASFVSCGLGIVGSVGIFTRMVCSIAGCLPRRSCKALAVGQLSAIVTWRGDEHATARRAHRGGGDDRRFRSRQLRLSREQPRPARAAINAGSCFGARLCPAFQGIWMQRQVRY
jgi:hypothetical protein